MIYCFSDQIQFDFAIAPLMKTPRNKVDEVHYSLHYAPPLIYSNTPSHLKKSSNRQNQLNSQKSGNFASTTNKIKMPLSAPTSPRFFNKTTPYSRRYPNQSPHTTKKGTLNMSLRHMRRMLNIKTEIDINSFVETIDKNDYLHYDFSFFDDKDLCRVSPFNDSIIDSNPNQAPNSTSFLTAEDVSTLTPAELVLQNFKEKTADMKTLDTESKRFSYIAHLIGDSLNGIRENHKGSLCDSHILDYTDIAFVQRELDVFFAAMNECAREVYAKSKSLSVILHTIQKGLLGNSRRLIQTIVNMQKEANNRKNFAPSEPAPIIDPPKKNRFASTEIQQIFRPNQSSKQNASFRNSTQIDEFQSNESIQLDPESNNNLEDNNSPNENEEQLKSKISSLKKKLNVLNTKNSDLNLSVVSLQMQLKQAKSQFQSLYDYNEKSQETIQTLNEKISQLEKENKRLQKGRRSDNSFSANKISYDELMQSVHHPPNAEDDEKTEEIMDSNENTEILDNSELNENSEIIEKPEFKEFMESTENNKGNKQTDNIAQTNETEEVQNEIPPEQIPAEYTTNEDNLTEEQGGN